MGDATPVDTLRIEWPSGIVQEFHDLPVKRTLTIVERTQMALIPNGSGKLAVKLTGTREQRYRLESSTNLTTWSPVTFLTITNADATAHFEYLPAEKEAQRFFRAFPE